MQKGRKEIHRNVAYAEGKSMLSLLFNKQVNTRGMLQYSIDAQTTDDIT